MDGRPHREGAGEVVRRAAPRPRTWTNCAKSGRCSTTRRARRAPGSRRRSRPSTRSSTSSGSGWLLDRRVYLIHVQMAGTVNREWKSELIERYRFQLEVQRLWSMVCTTTTVRAGLHPIPVQHTAGSTRTGRGGDEHPPRRVARSRRSFRRARHQPARDEELRSGRTSRTSSSKRRWFRNRPSATSGPTGAGSSSSNQGGAKCFRLHCKSLGGILALQEKITTQWKVLREPISAEVMEPEPVAAVIAPAAPVVVDAIPAEAVAAAIPAEAIKEERSSEPLPVTWLPRHAHPRFRNRPKRWPRSLPPRPRWRRAYRSFLRPLMPLLPPPSFYPHRAHPLRSRLRSPHGRNRTAVG